jgi:hypothetical protein
MGAIYKIELPMEDMHEGEERMPIPNAATARLAHVIALSTFSLLLHRPTAAQAQSSDEAAEAQIAEARDRVARQLTEPQSGDEDSDSNTHDYTIVAGQPPAGDPLLVARLSEQHQYEYTIATLQLSQTYTIGVFAITAITIAAVILVLLRRKGTRDGWTRMNLAALVLPLVIGGGLAMVSAGFSRDQMLAPMTLFGTIVGYLLGNLSSDPPSTDGGPGTHSNELPKAATDSRSTASDQQGSEP